MPPSVAGNSNISISLHSRTYSLEKGWMIVREVVPSIKLSRGRQFISDTRFTQAELDLTINRFESNIPMIRLNDHRNIFWHTPSPSPCKGPQYSGPRMPLFGSGRCCRYPLNLRRDRSNHCSSAACSGLGQRKDSGQLVGPKVMARAPVSQARLACAASATAGWQNTAQPSCAAPRQCNDVELSLGHAQNI